MQRIVSQKAPHWETSHTYDAVGNLVSRELTDSQGSLNYTYTYDDLYQLSSETGHVSHTYAHDSLQNRIAKNNQPYSVNHLNQLLRQNDSSYTYDLNGNLTAFTQGGEETDLTYDALDRLIEVKKNGRIIQYRYDSFHRRTSKIDNGTMTDYLYLKDNEIGSIVDRGITELRVLALGKGAEIGAAIAIELNGKIYVPIHDPFGNVVTLLDLQGKPIANYRYSAFGEEEAAKTANPWRYSSKRVDPETGFVYFGRRYYMPSVGRWLTPDPLGFADGPNLYAYVHNKPFTSIDPDGQFAFLIPIVLSLAIDYCMPTLAAGLTEYAIGGSLAAGFLSGVASGYSDPLSSAFDPSTYALGDLDPYTFASNRAGMLFGMLLNCRPTNMAKSSTQAVANLARQKFTDIAITEAERTLAKTVTRQCTRTATQKTVRVAERNLLKGEIATVAKQAGRKRFVPDTNAVGAHSVFRREPLTGKISKYATYQPQTNPLNPSSWARIKRYDGFQVNEVHFNKVLQKQIRTPHVHDPFTPGGIRPAEIWEIPL